MTEPWQHAWRDYYDDLGVPRGAGPEAIHAAFRRLAFVYHPDRHEGEGASIRAEADRRFRIIATAYEVLGDAARRRAYDEAVDRALAGRPLHVGIEIEPDRQTLLSFTGDVVIRSHARLVAEGDVNAAIGLDCDDPDAELRNLDVHSCTHGRDDAVDVVVRARVRGSARRSLHLRYSLGGKAISQQVDVRLAPQPLLWFGRVRAERGLTVFLLVLGVLGLLLSPLAGARLGETGMRLVFSTGMLSVAAGVGGLLVRFVRTPGWHRQLRLRGRWGYVVLTIFAINIVRILLRYLS